MSNELLRVTMNEAQIEQACREFAQARATGGMSLHSAIVGAEDRIAAQLFLDAYDADNVSLWVRALREWNDRSYRGKVGKAVKRLRSAWWHDGSESARAECRAAAESLRTMLTTVRKRVRAAKAKEQTQ